MKVDVEFKRIGQSSEETDQVSADQQRKKNKFFCGYVGNCIVINIPPGYRFVIGPHWPGVLVAEGTIIGGSLLFLKFIELARMHISQTVAILMEYNVMFMFPLTSLLLFAVAIIDPGIVIPDQTMVDSAETDSSSGSNYSGTEMMSIDDNLSGDEDEETGNGGQTISNNVRRELRVNRTKFDCKKVGEPWCDICDVQQGTRKRISHCYDCNVCIEGIDHHCPWMGKCVGRGNMNVFILFNMCWILFLCELLSAVMFL